MWFSPLVCYFVPLRPRYSPQHPVIEHPHPPFLPQRERPKLHPHTKQQAKLLWCTTEEFRMWEWMVPCFEKLQDYGILRLTVIFFSVDLQILDLFTSFHIPGERERSVCFN
jgi:hypothetical protein